MSNTIKTQVWSTALEQLQEWWRIEKEDYGKGGKDNLYSAFERQFKGIEMFSAPHYVYYCSETNTLHLVMSEVFTSPPEIPGWANIGIFE